MADRREMEVPKHIYRDKGVSDAECRVLGVVVGFIPWRKPAQISTPSIPTLMELSGKSRPAVYRAIRGLVDKGILNPARNEQGVSGYTLSESLTSETNRLTSETDDPTSETVQSQKRESQHYRNHELNHEEREVEQKSDPLTAANGAQIPLIEFPGGGAERPDPGSELEQVIEKFNRERKNVNDYLVVQGQFKAGSTVRTVRPYDKEDRRLKKLVKLHGAETLCNAVDELATGIANGKNAEKFVYFAWKTCCRPGYVEDLLNRSEVRDSVEV